MEKKYYTCDAGSVAVECGGSYILYNNGYGDGVFKVYLFDNQEEFDNYIEDHSNKYNIPDSDYRFSSCAIFNNANVLDDDCLKNLSPEQLKQHTLFTLNGRYGIYYNSGKVYFVKWSC